MIDEFGPFDPSLYLFLDNLFSSNVNILTIEFINKGVRRSLGDFSEAFEREFEEPFQFCFPNCCMFRRAVNWKCKFEDGTNKKFP
jgi:hypothetical protein